MSQKRILVERRRIASACRRLAAGTRGVSAAEYAVVLGLVAAALLAAAYAFGPALNTTYRRLARSSRVLASATADPAPRAVGHDTGVRRASMITVAHDKWRLVHYALAGLGLLVAVLALVLEKTHKRRKPSDGDAENDPLPKQMAAALWKKRQQILRVLSGGAHRLFTDQLDVGHLMTLDLHTVEPATDVEEVRELMIEKNFRHLLVCGADGRLRGVISDRDLQRDGRTANDVMTQDPITVGSDTPVNQAMSLMLHRKISCLPVCLDGRPVGAMTTTDLIMTLQCVLQLLQTIRGVATGSAQAPASGQGAGQAPAEATAAPVA